MLPWTDRAGRFSALKIVALAASLLPAVWILGQWWAGWLGPKPIEAAIHQSGAWALRLLLATLFITPLRHLGNWPRLIAMRRTLGVAAFWYVVAHLTLYAMQEQWNLAKVASEIALRLYLTIGFAALVGLGVLAATSFDSAIKRLGAERWNRLHRLVHVLMAMAILHALIQSKLDVSEPMIMLGLYLAAFAVRHLRQRGIVNVAALVALAPLAGLATALLEAGWYAGLTGVDAGRVIAANWQSLMLFADLDLSEAFLSQRPAVAVLALSLILPIIFVLRRGSERTATRPGRAPTHPPITVP